jgi:serine/threonine-protein kinase
LLSPAKPARLDDYELSGPLGSGATARVFEGRHIASGTLVAIKMLDASARGSHELRERLAREAVLLTGVASPFVSKLLAFGWEDDQPFLVLERLEGETLGDVLKREGRLSVGRLAEWIEQLLIGIRDCHNANVIHRDIKPSNIYLQVRSGGERAVKLIDFGVARLNEIAKAGISLTSTHHLIGSMGYMAPEQLEYAKGVGPPADLYAVGVVIFRCVSGRLPFVGRSFEALQRLKCESEAPLLSSMQGVVKNDRLDALVARALARKPEQRYASASEMLQEWWQVAAALDRDAPLFDGDGTDVVFEDDAPGSTMVDSNPDAAQTNPHHVSTNPTAAKTNPNVPQSNPSLSVALDVESGSNPTADGTASLRALIAAERELGAKGR